MSGAQRKQAKKCESKKRFSSLSEAKRFISQLEKNGETEDKFGNRKPMRPYLCRVCFKIHIGHTPTVELNKNKRSTINENIRRKKWEERTKTS